MDKISINELIDLNKKNMEKYNNYMNYLKDVFRSRITKIKSVNILNFNSESEKLIIEIENINKQDNTINFINIIKDGDNVDVLISDEKREILKNQLLKNNSIIDDTLRFCNDNEFMNSSVVKTEYNNKEISVSIHPDMIMFDYDNIKFYYKSNDHTFRPIYRYHVPTTKVRNKKNIYEVVDNNFNNEEFNNLLNSKIIDIEKLPNYIKNKEKTLTKRNG